MKNCLYYQAHINKPLCWFFVAVLRSFEHMAFDRTIDKDSTLFEFFVPASTQSFFEAVMQAFQEQGVVLDWQMLPNRLENPKELL